MWNDPKKAQELGKEKKSLDDIVLALGRLTQEIEDNTELFEMSRADSDEARNYYNANATTRLEYGLYYVALTGFLAVMTHDVHEMLAVIR